MGVQQVVQIGGSTFCIQICRMKTQLSLIIEALIDKSVLLELQNRLCFVDIFSVRSLRNFCSGINFQLICSGINFQLISRC